MRSHGYQCSATLVDSLISNLLSCPQTDVITGTSQVRDHVTASRPGVGHGCLFQMTRSSEHKLSWWELQNNY